jgi:hypothetical protein
MNEINLNYRDIVEAETLASAQLLVGKNMVMPNEADLKNFADDLEQSLVRIEQSGRHDSPQDEPQYTFLNNSGKVLCFRDNANPTLVISRVRKTLQAYLHRRNSFLHDEDAEAVSSKNLRVGTVMEVGSGHLRVATDGGTYNVRIGNGWAGTTKVDGVRVNDKIEVKVPDNTGGTKLANAVFVRRVS